jgi:hypothetical protein
MLIFVLLHLPDGVDLHYLDKTNFKGYDGQDFVTIGQYTVESRLGLLTQVLVGFIELYKT